MDSVSKKNFDALREWIKLIDSKINKLEEGIKNANAQNAQLHAEVNALRKRFVTTISMDSNLSGPTKR